MSKTTDLVTALQCCVSCAVDACRGCQFYLTPGCIAELKGTAAEKIEEMTDRCARYAEEIAVLRERQRWIPVTERLPEDSVKECFIFVPRIPECIVCLGRYLGSGRWVLDGWYLTSEAVAYWMPLPEAL